MRSRITLKLTEYHLIYIKDGTKVTKIVSYKQIFEVSLRGGNIFLVNMYGGKDLTFYSPLASHIIQQLVTRVKVRLSLDKTSLINDRSPIGLNYSIAATETLINKITDENTTGACDTMSSFAAVLGDAYITRVTEARSKYSIIRRVSDSSVRRFSFNKKNQTEQKEYNLFTYKEGTGELNLRNFLQKLIFDIDSDEGSTLQDFTETFKEKGKVDINYWNGIY